MQPSPTVLQALFFFFSNTKTLVQNPPRLPSLLFLPPSRLCTCCCEQQDPSVRLCSSLALLPAPSLHPCLSSALCCRAQLDQACRSGHTHALLALKQAVLKLCWWNRKTRVSLKELLCLKRTVRGHSFTLVFHACTE